MQKLGDTVFDALSRRGYAIVHRFLPEEQRAEMAAAIRRILKPWDAIKDDPPTDRQASYYFPYPEHCLNRAIINREAISFAPRWLAKTMSFSRRRRRPSPLPQRLKISKMF